METRIITITDHGLFIDRWNFSDYFSRTDREIIIRLLANGRPVTCSFLESYRSGLNTSKSCPQVCVECIESGYSATHCPKYKNYYNRILHIKKLFEALELGTVLTPENKLKIKERGWKAKLSRNVNIEWKNSTSF
jgi:hypothetical protein